MKCDTGRERTESRREGVTEWKRALVCCALLTLAAASPASAEWHITPFGGLTMFGNTSIFDPEQGTGERHLHAGGSVAWLSRGIFGVEAIGTWTPGFFEGTPGFEDLPSLDFVTNSRTVSLMGNVMVTLPQRWTEYGLRPFVSGGLGLMHASYSGGPDAAVAVHINTFGVNIGGGAIGFLTERTGLRFDLRYHSNLNRPENESSFGPVHLRYVTASVGIVFRRGIPPRR